MLGKGPTPLDHTPEFGNILRFLSEVAARVRKGERDWRISLIREEGWRDGLERSHLYIQTSSNIITIMPLQKQMIYT